MSTKQLIERLTKSAGDVPREVEVLAVRQFTPDELQERARRVLATAAETYDRSWDRGDWIETEDRTLIRLTEGARAVVMHASGAMKLVTGLSPMDRPFRKLEEPERLAQVAQETAQKLKLTAWAGERGDLRFERLWQIKAAGGDRNGKITDPTLFRIVGAFRHVAGKLPVWGPASVALKLAGDATLDSLTIQIREPSGEVIDQVRTIPAERGAQDIAQQLSALMGPQDISLDEVAVPQWMHFGYLSLSKRKAQRFLEPVYVALVDVDAKEEAQGYLLVTAAAEKVYQPVCRAGSDAPRPSAVR